MRPGEAAVAIEQRGAKVRRTEDTEKRVKNVKLAVNAEANRQVFGHIVQAFDESMARKSTERPTTICRPIAKTAITTVAAAALVIIIVGFVVIHRPSRKQTDGQTFTDAAKSPGEMMTAMSLNIAYRKGGLEAVEKQGDRAFKMLRLQPTSISVRQLLEEFDSEEVERKEL